MNTHAKAVLSKSQKIFFLILLVLYALSLAFFLKSTVIATLTVLTFFYTANIFVSIYTLLKSMFFSEEIIISEVEIEQKREWPTYSILCPLYKEANILPDFIKNIENIDYPKDKLECLLLLEEDDLETLAAARKLSFPPYFKAIILQNSKPKTKPKACNVGLKYAKGDYLVIYDAEDKPEPDQLKKAVIAFERSALNVGCIQAKLNFYNPTQNFLTKMFTSEYTHWYDLVLPGMQAIKAPIPLGGTSNHFKTNLLRSLGGWDPYNVTEDCDLGIRLKKEGFDTEIINSTTWEEANSSLGNWIRQRSRWTKGYFQTFLVHTRRPLRALAQLGPRNFFLMILTTGFLPLTNLINPLLWATTISYFAFRPVTGVFIEQFFPAYILYPGVFCLVVGNFLAIYDFLISASKRGLHYHVKYGLLMPFYWILISIAGWYAFFQLLWKPHFWEKTKHGLIRKGTANA